MSTTINRVECPECHREIALRPESGTLRTHGPVGDRCPGSWRTPRQLIHRENWRELFREQWRIGDAIPVNNAILRTNPPDSIRDQVTYVSPDIPEGLDLDAELKFLVDHARSYIRYCYALLLEKDWTE